MTNNYDHIQAFLERHGLTGENRPYCGASFGPGWVPLLDRLVTDLKALGWDGECAQIKEKFGGLRFYIGGATEETFKPIHDRIAEAEGESLRTCEDCGAEGKCRTKKPDGTYRWYRTLCDACDVEDLKRYERK